ncbi:transcription termination factor Rho [Litorilinea aerophila]|uniref:transcription termination factor Rho n=1 Tax=Litorilinea aerophila TaxID=1204385 RepID=UPI0021DD5BF3|nr:transcription termination factor Rho [Litorilinea aerophila]GIV76745.1 MAG: transcription termination factor Rho [Litorilinea sp.]
MPTTASGVLGKAARGAGVLLDPERSFQPGPDDVRVPANLIRRYELVEGATVAGPVRRQKGRAVLADVTSICGLPPERFRERTPFQQLVAIDPNERFDLGASGEISMRVVDLIAPIGKGSRALIAAPPKAGKTTLLAQMAAAIHAVDPETRLIMLLVDERPEEVTHFRRTVPAEVLASSNDQPIREHVALAELALAHIRCELECGRNVVVFIDSLTRMARAFNLHGAGSRRTLSGGVDAAALEIPRRFFGLARNIENGGSVTVIATALIQTGSRMDDYIYEEFKATGNSELVLDRSLAEARLFPAVDVLASGTRKDEQLYPPELVPRLTKLRRWLAGGTPKVALSSLLKLLEQVPTNEELLRRINV